MLIDLHNAKVFIDGRAILENVHLAVNESDFVYVIGRVGSGKSSLLKMLYGELESKGERLNVLDCDLKKAGAKAVQALRRQLGIVFQESLFLAHKNVEYNLDSSFAPQSGRRQGSSQSHRRSAGTSRHGG